jgi:hypothetical protein
MAFCFFRGERERERWMFEDEKLKNNDTLIF